MGLCIRRMRPGPPFHALDSAHTTLKPGIAVESKYDGGRTATLALLPLSLCCARVCPSALAECDRRIFAPFLLKTPWLIIVLDQQCF